MSLVDYASSSEEEDEEEIAGEQDEGGEEKWQDDHQYVAPTTNHQNQSSMLPSRQPSNVVSPLPPPMTERLPDASLLFASPSFSSHQTVGNDHLSRVAAAMLESESRKRESNGSSIPYPRGKYPRGNLPHSRNVPETVGGLLVPPQLRGRSNVVTEDISKLFVRRDSLSSGDQTSSDG